MHSHSNRSLHAGHDALTAVSLAHVTARRCAGQASRTRGSNPDDALRGAVGVDRARLGCFRVGVVEATRGHVAYEPQGSRRRGVWWVRWLAWRMQDAFCM
jgi:hypothetical protein